MNNCLHGLFNIILFGNDLDLVHFLRQIYFSQKQLPSAWNQFHWLANCRPIPSVKLRENRKRFS